MGGLIVYATFFTVVTFIVGGILAAVGYSYTFGSRSARRKRAAALQDGTAVAAVPQRTVWGTIRLLLASAALLGGIACIGYGVFLASVILR